MPEKEPIPLLVTLNEAYIPYLNVMLASVLEHNPGETFSVYLLHGGIPEPALADTRRLLSGCGELIPLTVAESGLDGAPTTDRYPQEIYYRLFAARYLPDTLPRVLYLDPDVVVRGALRPLFELPMGDSLFAAASHIGELLHRINERRLDMEEDSPYINSGVMLMNLTLLRREQDTAAVFAYMEAHRARLILPDQDIISGLYSGRILPLDPFRYNMTERLFAFRRRPGDRPLDLDAVRRDAVIIHYCGRNKPWKPGYVGRLNVFYDEAAAALAARLNKTDG